MPSLPPAGMASSRGGWRGNNRNPHDVDNVSHSTQFMGIGFGFLDLLNDCGSGVIEGYNG